MPRESGASSTPRLLDSGLAASGILDHPLSWWWQLRLRRHSRIKTAALLSERGGRW